MHYYRWWQNGDPLTVQVARPAEERFWEKVRLEGECWIWTGATQKIGYGTWKPQGDGPTWLSHRWAYTTMIGDIPAGLVLDHLCRTRACVNPYHLDPVTQQVNVDRGMGNQTKTHCPYNHEYTPENTYYHGAGRVCKACTARRAREQKQRRRNQRNAPHSNIDS